MQTPEILYEDDQILVCHKPAGVPVQTKKIGTQDMESILKNYLFIHSSHHAGHKPPYLAVIHRLDQPVSGILVFARGQSGKETGESMPARIPRRQKRYVQVHFRCSLREMPIILENYIRKRQLEMMCVLSSRKIF